MVFCYCLCISSVMLSDSMVFVYSVMMLVVNGWCNMVWRCVGFWVLCVGVLLVVI